MDIYHLTVENQSTTPAVMWDKLFENLTAAKGYAERDCGREFKWRSQGKITTSINTATIYSIRKRRVVKR